MKKYLLISFWLIISFINIVFAEAPKLLELWLPWEEVDPEKVATEIGGGLIATLIKYVAVIAVIALMLSWIMYLMSGWEEEKIKKAKNWILWSLVWVLLSISAWWIINLINNLQINN